MKELVFTGKMERAEGRDFFLEALADDERVLILVPAWLADRKGIEHIKSLARLRYEAHGAPGGRIELSGDHAPGQHPS